MIDWIKSFFINNSNLTVFGAFIAGFCFHHRLIIAETFLNQESYKFILSLNNIGFGELIFMPLIYTMYIICFVSFLKAMHATLLLIFKYVEQVLTDKVTKNMNRYIQKDVKEQHSNQTYNFNEMNNKQMHDFLKKNILKYEEASKKNGLSSHGMGEVKSFLNHSNEYFQDNRKKNLR